MGNSNREEEEDCIIDVEGCDGVCEKEKRIALHVADMDQEETRTTGQPAITDQNKDNYEQIEKTQNCKPIIDDHNDFRKQTHNFSS